MRSPSSTQEYVILGAGGLTREVLSIFREANKDRSRWDLLGFVDENLKAHGKILCDLAVLRNLGQGGLHELNLSNDK